ncbi:hypothetical protein M5K25_001155 [Dendrobium thyrsiflorum]|uniref:Uncharacterized protein n=1 Tax=Dendrobium thyrsiflorum TaxID=117978 RepID=A0ABD0WB21_DENTH
MTLSGWRVPTTPSPLQKKMIDDCFLMCLGNDVEYLIAFALQLLGKDVEYLITFYLQVYHHKLKTGVGGNEDEPDQDPMVPSSRAAVFPGLLSQRSPKIWRKIRQPSGVPSPAPGGGGWGTIEAAGGQAGRSRSARSHSWQAGDGRLNRRRACPDLGHGDSGRRSENVGALGYVDFGRSETWVLAGGGGLSCFDRRRWRPGSAGKSSWLRQSESTERLQVDDLEVDAPEFGFSCNSITGSVEDFHFIPGTPSSCLIIFIVFLEIAEALASKFLSLSTGIFCQQIPEYEVQVSCSNVHHVELILVFLELLWQLVTLFVGFSQSYL